MTDRRPSERDSVPALFRTLKNSGFIACLVGALVMIAGRYMAGAPRWLTYLGVSVIVLGWGLFAYALVRRAAYLRSHAPGGGPSSAKS